VGLGGTDREKGFNRIDSKKNVKKKDEAGYLGRKTVGGKKEDINKSEENRKKRNKGGEKKLRMG